MAPPLPNHVLTALGLVATGCVGAVKDTSTTDSITVGPCLQVITTPTGDTGETTTTGPCLDYYTETGETGTITETGDTGTISETADTGTGGSGAPASRSAVFERLSADGVLPPDVVERLKRRAE